MSKASKPRPLMAPIVRHDPRLEAAEVLLARAGLDRAGPDETVDAVRARQLDRLRFRRVGPRLVR